MAAYTASQIRDKIQEAIVDILDNGQQVEWNGQKYDKANIDELFKEERRYNTLAKIEDFSSSRTRYSGRVRYTRE